MLPHAHYTPLSSTFWLAQHSQTRLLTPHHESVPFSALSTTCNLERNRVSDTATDSSDRIALKGSQRTFLTAETVPKGTSDSRRTGMHGNLSTAHFLPNATTPAAPRLPNFAPRRCASSPMCKLVTPSRRWPFALFVPKITISNKTHTNCML